MTWQIEYSYEMEGETAQLKRIRYRRTFKWYDPRTWFSRWRERVVDELSAGERLDTTEGRAGPS